MPKRPSSRTKSPAPRVQHAPASAADGPASWVTQLNRGVRAARARVVFVEERPFGANLRLRRYQLGNGLVVLLLVDRSAPVISFHSWLRVGSRDEQPGKTGLAHLFEHLMFNETEHEAQGSYDRTIEAVGGDTNAATWVDWTYYHANLPASELELIVRLEADRMQHLVLRGPQVASEKEVVANERRYRVEDDVEGTVSERLYATAFRQHPYHWPTIGWMTDIENFSVADCERFYRTFYAPNNATLVIAGDFDEATALQIVQRHYGPMKAATLPERVRVVEPPQRGQRKVELTWPTPTPKLQLGYRAPALADPDHAALTVASDILFGGRSSRLQRKLVHDGEIASVAHGSLAPFSQPGLYEIWVSLREGHTPEAALAIIDDNLARLREKPVSQSELNKVKNRLELGFLQGMETAGGKAEQIGFYETAVGDAGFAFKRLEQYRGVTAADVQRVARRYFDVRRRTMVVVRPGEAKGEVIA